MDSEQVLARLASKQHGLFTREQALEAGLTKWAIYRRLGAGEWISVQPRVFRFRHAAYSWHQAVRAATLSLGPSADWSTPTSAPVS